MMLNISSTSFPTFMNALNCQLSDLVVRVSHSGLPLLSIDFPHLWTFSCQFNFSFPLGSINYSKNKKKNVPGGV